MPVGKKVIKPGELKVAVLNVRVRPSVKAMAERCADQDRRSIAQYIELLIEADATRRGISGS
jgi:predicted HicB family RNase H-like nuclease